MARKRRLIRGMEIWEDPGGGTTIRRLPPTPSTAAKPQAKSGSVGRTIVTQSNRVSYRFPITKPGGVRETEAEIWRAIRSVAPSDKSARHFMSAYAKWQDEDEEDDPPRRNAASDDWSGIGALPEINGVVDRMTDSPEFRMQLGYLTGQRDARSQYWQQQGNTPEAAILQASVMIVARNPVGYRNSLGIGTIVGGNIVTHDHLGIGDAPFIEIVGAYGTIRMTGAEFNAMMASNATQALNGVRVIGAQAAGLDLGSIGQEVGATSTPYDQAQSRSDREQFRLAAFNAAWSDILNGQNPNPIRYVYNPDGYLNDRCLDHACLQVREMNSSLSGSVFFPRNFWEEQIRRRLGLPEVEALSNGVDFFASSGSQAVDHVWFGDTNWANAVQSRVSAYGSAYNLEYELVDHPFSPGDSGAGFFMGDQLIGVYQASADPSVRAFSLFPDQLE